MGVRDMATASSTIGLIVLAGCQHESERSAAPSSTTISAESRRAKILLVHSYHRKYEWVAGISQGVKRALETADVDLETCYMDTKRRTGEAWKIESGQLALETAADWDPDIVIAVDDNCQQYFARHLVGRTRPYVIFCGVNAPPSDYGYPASNATGVKEVPHFQETLELLGRIKPGLRRIAVISDNSPTSLAALQYMRSQPAPLEIVAWKTPGALDEWQQQVLAVQGKADAIITYTYHTLAQKDSDRSAAPDEVMAWTVRNSRIPLAGFFSFAIDDGMLCGVVESAVEHGLEAGRMARQVLAGRPPDEIEVVTACHTQSMLNLETARKLGIEIPEEVLGSMDIVIGEMHAQ